METNVGEKDRKIRLAVGIGAGVLALMSRKGRWRIPLTLVALAGLGSAMSGYCFINKALGIDTTALDDDQGGASSSDNGARRQPVRM